MKVFLDMVGCRLNQSEIENYARQFRLAGHSLTSDVESANLIVINTCTVTAAAASDSRQKIRQAGRTNAEKIIVTGCWATLNPHQANELARVSQVIGNLEKDNLVPLVLNIPIENFNHRSIQREPIPGARLRTRAFIKVQDGCDNHCTYCVTTLARGVSRSRPIDEILQDIRSALDGDTQEVVLTGVHLGSWGYDFILQKTDTPRLRLSSLEPWDISFDFLELWGNSRLCRHLHLPLQSGSASVLKRMGRRVTPESYANLLHHARAAIPGVAITTDIITGFPGETDSEFTESISFVKEMGFAAGHVFTYSPRPGTAAAELPGQVNHAVAKQRSAAMREILQTSAYAYRQGHIGQVLPVLWEKATPTDQHHWELNGLTDNYLRVNANFLSPCHNRIMNVHITGVRQAELVGDISLDEYGAMGVQDTI
jgi:threonylcarbamoyladenosine tRNA methylthiotransferase MtaB